MFDIDYDYQWRCQWLFVSVYYVSLLIMNRDSLSMIKLCWKMWNQRFIANKYWCFITAADGYWWWQWHDCGFTKVGVSLNWWELQFTLYAVLNNRGWKGFSTVSTLGQPDLGNGSSKRAQTLFGGSSHFVSRLHELHLCLNLETLTWYVGKYLLTSHEYRELCPVLSSLPRCAIFCRRKFWFCLFPETTSGNSVSLGPLGGKTWNINPVYTISKVGPLSQHRKLQHPYLMAHPT